MVTHHRFTIASMRDTNSTPSAYTSLMRAESTGEYCASSQRPTMAAKRSDSAAATPRRCSSSRTLSFVRLAAGMLKRSLM